MNKTLTNIWIGLVCVFVSSCVERIDLEPFTVPDLVKSYVRKVECYDEYNVAFIATDRGILLRYGDDQITFNSGNYAILTQIEWENARVLYSNETQVFWVIEDDYILEVSGVTLKVYNDTTEFFQPTRFYFDYALSNEGKLFRTGFYKEVWDPSGGFESDYFISLYEFQGFESGMWEEYETDMTVISSNLNSPNMYFESNGDLILATNPQYRVTAISEAEVSFQTLGKQGIGFDYDGMSMPHTASNGKMYGFDKTPQPFDPIIYLMETELDGNDVVRSEAQFLCEIDENAQGLVKVLDWNGTTVRFYAQFYTNANSEDKSKLGYIVSYNVDNGGCNVVPIISSEDLRTSDPIEDLDILGSYVFIGTREELLIYDLETQAIESYLNILFQERQE